MGHLHGVNFIHKPHLLLQYLCILCMNLQLHNLCSQFKSTQKSLDAAEHLVYSDLCYGTLSSIRNEVISEKGTEKGRKCGGRVFSQIDPCFPELTLRISRLLFGKKRKKKVIAMSHSMASWPPPSQILSRCLKTINLSKFHGNQEGLTYVQIDDGDEESMIWCQNDHHGILIKFN